MTQRLDRLIIRHPRVSRKLIDAQKGTFSLQQALEQQVLRIVLSLFRVPSIDIIYSFLLSGNSTIKIVFRYHVSYATQIGHELSSDGGFGCSARRRLAPPIPYAPVRDGKAQLGQLHRGAAQVEALNTERRAEVQNPAGCSLSL